MRGIEKGVNEIMKVIYERRFIKIYEQQHVRNGLANLRMAIAIKEVRN